MITPELRDKAMHVTRNPHGWDEETRCAARLLVCDWVEELQRENARTAALLAGSRAVVAALMPENERLRVALLTLLDQVDYTVGACGLADRVGACLPPIVIKRARAALTEQP